MSTLHGIVPAVVTPFDGSGRFDERAFARLVARLYRAGVHGLYVCGQTGEGLQQPPNQRKHVAEAALRESPSGAQIIVHVGAATTSVAIDLARHAAATGAHAVSSLPPLGSYSFAEIREYYAALAAASDVPLFVYYCPALVKSIETFEQIAELCAIPNISGLKFTGADLFTLWRIRKAGALVLNGIDEMLAAGLLMGAHGGIGSFYNVFPEVFVALYDAARAGRWDEARALQDQVNEVIALALRYPVHAAIKVLLSALGCDCGTCLPPRASLTARDTAALLEALSRTTLGEARFARTVSP